MRKAGVERKKKAYAKLHQALAPNALGRLYLDIVGGVYSSHLAPGAGAIDCGAFYGVQTLSLARCVWPMGKVWAIDAQPEPLQALAQQLRRTRMEDVVQCTAVALSDQAGVAPFHRYLGALGMSGIMARKLPETLAAQVTVDIQETRLARLDDVLPPDATAQFMLLNVQGGEYRALLGARQFLAREQPIIAFENAREAAARDYDYTAAEFFQFFEDLGYKVYDCLGFDFGEADWSVPRQPWWYFAIPADQPLLHGTVHGAIDAVLDSQGLGGILS